MLMRTGTILSTSKDIPKSSFLLPALALMKYRLLFLVIFSTLMGYFINGGSLSQWPALLGGLLGVFLIGGSANTLNQYLESQADARMQRTRNRPLVVGSISKTGAVIFGAVLFLAGIWLIENLTGHLQAVISALTWLVYLYLYTPLKIRHYINTWVGAIPGALPALLGASIASGKIDATGLAFFVLLFFWQMPHFFSISWIYREDYLLGGFKMISAEDEAGMTTARHVFGHSFLTLVSSYLVIYTGACGVIYGAVATLAGLWMCWLARQFMLDVSVSSARKVFFFSIIYLPILFAGIILEAIIDLL